MEEKTFRVVLSGHNSGAERMRARLKKYFRRRAASVEACEGGALDVRLRNGTRLRYAEIPAGKFWREPFAEMTVRTTDSYMRKSVQAMHDYAKKCDFSLVVDAHEEKPKR